VNAFDVGFLAFLAVLTLVGALKGLTRLIIGVGALIAAFLVVAHFQGRVTVMAASLFALPSSVAQIVAYLALFFGTMLGGALLAFAFRRLVKAAMLGWVDRLAGGALGVVVVTLMSGFVALPLLGSVPNGKTMLKDSVLAPYVTLATDTVIQLVPDHYTTQYRDNVESLRRLWRPHQEASSILSH